MIIESYLIELFLYDNLAQHDSISFHFLLRFYIRLQYPLLKSNYVNQNPYHQSVSFCITHNGSQLYAGRVFNH